MSKFDFKKEYKDLYLPGKQPVMIDIPTMKFIMVEGKGDPNTCKEYSDAMEILYGLSYGIKMSKMNGTQPEGYFEYVVPPLEGLWWIDEENFDYMNITDKNKFCWISMIRQPDFVTEAVFEQAKINLQKKKPDLEVENAYLKSFTEGLCAQVMHLGPYDDEPETVKRLISFIEESGYEQDMSGMRMHHEIYLGDPRKAKPENLKTVIRHPIRKRKQAGQ
jgi:hypothetical protein